MFRQVKALFVAMLLTCNVAAHSAAGPDDPPGRVARISHAAGAVSFAPYEAPDAWGQAVLNRPLTSGDRLWVDQNGRAEVHAGSTVMRLGALTSADVLNLDDDILQVRLAQGTLNVRVRDLDADDVVEIATPAGAVLLRQPGSYRISADPSGGFARVLVNFGQAEVVTPLQRYTVPSGQSVTLSAAGGPASFEVAAYAGGDEFDRWSADRDRREDRSTSARYVSRDTIGYGDLDNHGSWRTLPEYGAVWVPTRVAPGWAPFRHGHWAWVSPWGWTWIDDAPWGFAPSHYGRWVRHDNYWAWAPGRISRRPVYAPAVVAFVGGSNFSVSVGSGPAVGWFPLGWREPYVPWYRASHHHVRRVNVTHVTNVTNVTNVRHVNRERHDAVTVVSRQAFVSARPVAQSTVQVSRNELARAEIVRDRSPAEPSRSSLAPERAGQRPPATVAAREVVSVNAPATAGSDRPARRERPAFARDHDNDADPRVRVLRNERERDRDRDRDRNRNQAQPAERPAATAVAPAVSAPAAAAPTAQAPAPAAKAAAPASPAPTARTVAPPEAGKSAPPPASAVVTTTPPRAPDAERRERRVEQREMTQDRHEAAGQRREAAVERGEAPGQRREITPERREAAMQRREVERREVQPAQVHGTTPREAPRQRLQQAENRAPEQRNAAPQHRDPNRAAPPTPPNPTPQQLQQQRARQGDG